MKTNSDKLEALANSGKLTINRMIFSKKKMTGQEWYGRFEEELDHSICDDYGLSDFRKIMLEIAKKASEL